MALVRSSRLVASAALALLLTSCRANGERPPLPALRHGQFRGWNVLLVTIDTLRRDRVGAFGGATGLTPVLDRLAASGVRFTHAYSHVPMTLPAHTTIMTGLTPRHTGVHNNTSGTLHSDVGTLATWLKDAGYSTGAFVGAFVLDRRFGLARGFDEYDDRIEHAGETSFRIAERSGAAVVRAAGDWLAAVPRDQRWFAWVHLFDPHAPYAAPPSCQPGRTPYDAEVACTDTAIGALLDRLRDAQRLDRTLVIVTADHGESLGEHGEMTHGLFAYNATLAVPLIISAPGISASAVDAPVAHTDIAPTVLDTIGIAVPEWLDGRSLAQPLPAERSIYFEALDASITRGWAPLRGIVRQSLKYIDLPDDELYDLAADPGERVNRLANDPRGAAAMRGLLKDATADREQSAADTPLDAAAAARLRSLGYVTSRASTRPPTLADDPKRLVALNEQFNSALAAFDDGAADAALESFLAILQARPDFLTARTSAARILLMRGEAKEAVRLMAAAPADQRALAQWSARMGTALREAGRLDDAAGALEAAHRQDPDDLDAAQELATTYAALGRLNESRTLFETIARRSDAATAWYNLGLLHLQRGEKHDASVALRRAVEREPSYGDAWNGLGAALVESDPVAAAEAWRHALVLRPRDYDLLFNLGVVLAERGRPADAEPYLRRFVAEAPPARYARDIEHVRALLARIPAGAR